MNYLKRIGRLVAICICAVCVGIIPITAHGEIIMFGLNQALPI